MADPIYYLEILFGIAALVIAFRASVLLFEIHEVEDELEKERAKMEYEKALKYYLKHPSNLKAKKICYDKGDKYYRHSLPDFFSYPLPDFDTHVEFLDHQKEREKLVTKDLDQRMRERKKAA